MANEVLSFLTNLPKFAKLSIYAAPNIPEKKLNNAIKSYGLDTIHNSDVVLLIDDTVFGSAKDGLFITKDKFFFHSNGDKQNGLLESIVNVANNEQQEIILSCNNERKWYVKINHATKNDISAVSEYLLNLSRLLIGYKINNTEVILVDENNEKEDIKNPSKFMVIFNQYSQPIFNNLKDSGIQLTSSTLQNDENILRVANVIYAVLPSKIKLLLSLSMVEKFLLENRQWLIDKLK